MATVRDSDISLWLHNKLGTSNDSWTSGSICSQLNNEVLRNIKDCFPDLQTQVKLKLLLSFFHIPRRNVEEWRTELEEIVEVAQVDSEQWVSMLAEMMKTLPATGSLNTAISENEQNRRIFSDLVNDLKKLVRKQGDLNLLPLECHYLNKSALNNIVDQLPQPVKHFTLKRKPKSAALRAELMQKSLDAASNLKKSAAPTVPVRSRGMPRKMTDTTPLKGIPSRVPSGGFQSSLSSNSLISRPSLPRNPMPRKDGGIKLLDINEQPISYAQAKKRMKMQEIEETKLVQQQQQQIQPQAQPQQTSPSKKLVAVGEQNNTGTGVTNVDSAPAATPDYAAGLAPPPSVVQVGVGTEPNPPSYAPNSATGYASSLGTPINPTGTTEITQLEVERPQTITMIRPQIMPEERKYELTVNNLLIKEQLTKAQELFGTANKVTRPEKSLILGFIAGSRENPCPAMGDIITIKLSEYEETVRQDSVDVRKIVETHFQMNYVNGEWNLINRYRDIELT
uniref:HDAg domain-containing protein n=1 Tax=Rhodnius prolixus TaxID=13249 RepID=T1HWI8_RHOPR